jgi:glycosyltransferase involved in cell wall biosynthesis
MRPIVLVVPGRLETLTGGYIYDRRMADELRGRGWSVEITELADGFPRPTPEMLEEAATEIAAIPAGSIVLVDSLALGAMPDIIEREASRLRLVALVHLPLAAETGLDRETAAGFEASERRALRAVSLVIVTGLATIALLAAHGIGRDRIVIVEPGTDRAPLAGGSSDGGPLRFLSVATLTPRKGHEILLHALAGLPDRNWRLVCAGSLTRHPPTVDRVRATLRRLELESRVSLVGELEGANLEAAYAAADVFVQASLLETYGMAVAEALARGLPIVATTTGAVPQLVGDAAGLLVRPGSPEALGAALARVVADTALRGRLVAGARRVRDRLRSWKDAAETLSDALERLDARV